MSRRSMSASVTALLSLILGCSELGAESALRSELQQIEFNSKILEEPFVFMPRTDRVVVRFDDRLELPEMLTSVDRYHLTQLQQSDAQEMGRSHLGVFGQVLFLL